jgi:adenylylsulfate kinase-like enzyme
LTPGNLSESRDANGCWAIWITGRPGSGKTTLAKRAAQAVTARGIRVKVLDMGTLRRFRLDAVTASESQQEIAHRALAYAAKLLAEAGVAVIVDATAPRRAWRAVARELIPCFAEVQLLCPADICVERERAARWRLTGAEAAPDVLDLAPDISVEYEESLRPELILYTNVHDCWSAGEQILFLIHRLHRTPPLRLEQPSRSLSCESES